VQLELLKPVLVLGIVQAGMYGMLPIAVILSYRINRTIAFVHGGIAMSAGLIYWILVFDNPVVPGSRPGLDPMLGLLLTVGAGAVLGTLYGAVVMTRWVAAQNRMTLTVVSMAGMMLAVGVFTSTLKVPAEILPPGPFGDGTVTVAGVVITSIKMVTMLVVSGLVLVLALFLTRTRTGLAIRAMADDLEASAWCGTKLARVGTAVYGVSGGIAALAGALIAAMVGPDVSGMFTLFLRGLALAVVGGLTSLPIALCGALLFGILETALVVDLFGHVSPGWQEIVINAALLGAILLVAKTRRDGLHLLERQAL
jgi:branched-subunit amino acid ABC-type transport system permease component